MATDCKYYKCQHCNIKDCGKCPCDYCSYVECGENPRRLKNNYEPIETTEDN